MTPKTLATRVLDEIRSEGTAEAPLRFMGHELSFAFLGNLLSKSLGFLTFVVVTNTLGPGIYARFALADLVLQIAHQVSELGLEIGVVRLVAKGLRAQGTEATDRALKAVFLAKLVFGSLTFALAWHLSPWIAAVVLESGYSREMTTYIHVALLGMLGVHLTGFFQAYFTARFRFASNAAFSICTPLAMFLAILTARLLGRLDVLTYLWIHALTPGIVSVVALAALSPGFLRARPSLASLRTIWQFSRWIYVTNTLAEIRFRTAPILLSRLVTDAQNGLYLYADRLAAMVTLFTTTTLTVFIPRASRLVSQGELKDLLRQSYRWIAGLVPFLLLAPFVARPLLTLLAPTYAKASSLFVVLFISILFTLAAIPARTVLYSVHRPKVETWIQLAAFAFTIGGGAYLVPRYGAMGAALTMLVQRFLSAGALMAWVYYFVYRAPREQVETPHLTGTGHD